MRTFRFVLVLEDHSDVTDDKNSSSLDLITSSLKLEFSSPMEQKSWFGAVEFALLLILWIKS